MISLATIQEKEEILSLSKRIHGLKEDDLLSYLTLEDLSLYLLKEENLIGFLCLRKSFPTAEIDYIIISEDKEGKGYGTFFVSEILSLFCEKGYEEVLLEVRESNHRAIKLYERVGFTFYRRRKNYYEKPTEDALCYRKELRHV